MGGTVTFPREHPMSGYRAWEMLIIFHEMKTSVATVEAMIDRKMQSRLSDARALRELTSSASDLQSKNSCFPRAREFKVVSQDPLYAFV